MRHRFALSLLGTLAFLLVPSPADACSCKEIPSYEEAAEGGSAFWGTFVSTEEHERKRVAKLEVKRVYAGKNPGRYVTVTSSKSTCGSRLREGESYLIAGKAGFDGSYSVGNCEPSHAARYPPPKLGERGERDWKEIRTTFDSLLKSEVAAARSACGEDGANERDRIEFDVYPDGSFAVGEVARGPETSGDEVHCVRRKLLEAVEFAPFDAGGFNAAASFDDEEGLSLFYSDFRERAPQSTVEELRAQLLRVDLPPGESESRLAAFEALDGVQKRRATVPVCRAEGYTAAREIALEHGPISIQDRRQLRTCALRKDDVGAAIDALSTEPGFDGEYGEYLELIRALRSAKPHVEEHGLPVGRDEGRSDRTALDHRGLINHALTTDLGWQDSPVLLEAVAQALIATANADPKRLSVAGLAYRRAALLRPDHASDYLALAAAVEPPDLERESVEELKRRWEEETERAEREEIKATKTLVRLREELGVDEAVEEPSEREPTPLQPAGQTDTSDTASHEEASSGVPLYLWAIVGLITFLAAAALLVMKDEEDEE